MNFDELRLDFEVVRQRFQEAKTLEERLQLLAISKQIMREAEGQIVRFVSVFKSEAGRLP
jgi:Tfp pilus assembly protein PilN